MAPDFNALADATRRTILALLRLEGELCVCELEAALDLIQPVVSRQLALLREAGWVEGRREGRRMFYRLPAALPAWALLVVRGCAEGGVPADHVVRARARLHRFEGRPTRTAIQVAS
ncbi:MAG: metalloregulator ArsR/SmtB family transcription factor [Gemmatimonadaceae bacterium]|nr:metalloregulator ArsR/SmtB family transcription factor [Gemmatimonadaceae bacterium]